MEGKEQKNLSWLVSYLNQNRPWFENVIKNLFGDSEGYAPDFELSSLDLLLDFKTKLVIAIIEKHVQPARGIEGDFKGCNIDVNKLFEDKNTVNQTVQDELDKLLIPDESMNVILKNFLDNGNLNEITLAQYEDNLTLDSNNNFIKICKFMYQMLENEKPLHKLNNGSDTMTPLRGILKKYKAFFKEISHIKNIKDYFSNLDEIECGDQTFQKLINEFGGALNIRNTIINSDVFTGKTEETKEKTKPDIKDKVVNDDNNKIKMNLLKIRAIIEEACEIIFSFGGLGLTALIALGILPWGALGIGICATLAFMGITRFIATNSWTGHHNSKYSEQKLFYRSWNFRLLLLFKLFITPAISLIAGAILTALGATGVLSLGLGLSLGIPLVLAFVVGLMNFILRREINKNKPDYYILNPQHTDNLWGIYMGIFALIATATFLGLVFGGILALPTAIALAAPLCILGVTIGLLTLFAWSVNKCGPEKLKNYLKNKDGEVSCLGLGYFKDTSMWQPDEIIEKVEIK